MVKDTQIYLKLIVDSIMKIDLFTDGVTKESFVTDMKTQSAVIMKLQIIGEISKKIPEDTKEKIDLPWKQISGLRDVISHDYFSLDVELVWNILQDKLPEVRSKIEGHLKV